MKIFVFGSNLAGRHGKGAALCARQEYGAEYGVGEGRTGNAYAIPTKGRKLEVLPLIRIEQSVKQFLTYAAQHTDLEFLVTRIGCGLAGYKDHEIAPFFSGATPNVVLPTEWLDYYTKRSRATKVGGTMSFVVHCKQSSFDVYIGRGQGSIFGNPFTHKEGTQAAVVVGSREEAVKAFQDWLAGTAWQDVEPERRQSILDAIPSLKGKVLGCWCSPLACHGDVLAEFANGCPEPVAQSPIAAPKPVPTVAPGNIHSGTKNGLAVLTNPTVMAKRKGTVRGDFPVTVDGKLYEDAEAAYQEIKWTIPNTDKDREDLCVRVIAAKLEQYPQLVEFIRHNGGVTWLSKCSHHVHAQSSGFQYWEGDGFDSAFIRCLIKAYKLVR